MSESHDFFALERRIQDRLVASVRREASPVMLARTSLPSRRGAVVLGLAVAVVLGVALFGVGLGRVGSPVFRHPPATIAAHLAWLVLVGASLLVLRRKQRSARALPIGLGRYLFASGVLDVSAERIVFRPLVSSTVTGNVATCDLGNETMRFTIAEGELEAVKAELDTFARVLASGAKDAIDDGSPLALPRWQSPIAPLAPYRFEPTFAERRPIVATLVWAAPLAGLLFVSREVVSDELAFRDARAKNDVGAYAAYAARGKAHVSAVKRTYLPRAALASATSAGTVEAIERFRADFPTTDIEPEVAAAREAAVKAELARASATGTLAALRDHARRFPNETKAERDAAIIAHYTHERSRATARLAGHDPTRLGAAIAVLYAKPAAEPLAVHTEGRRDEGKGIDLAERAVTRTITWNGKKTLPGAIMSDHELDTRAHATADLAREVLRPALESDALPFADTTTAKPKDAPRLVVTREVDWSGRVFTALKPRVAVAGINVRYQVALVLASGATAWRYETMVSEGVNAAQIKKEGDAAAPHGGPLEEQLYRGMQDAADKTFRARLAAAVGPEARGTGGKSPRAAVR